ncbi:lytic transglycosylase domain-containing protein [Allofranklinella schreckenbergeri]|uniref:Lytic transglycosylase domain-containing protein n=2 Tax=Allofranklinella schreckenbergeri TaxID=1076744 RepID=A0A3M6QWS0_9BURK|nr:lytic transglycosylase domain-containing protein [Allofranklinella schreckenbergeri]
MLALFLASLLAAAYLHGKACSGPHNFWTTAASVVIHLAILYAGGFFSPSAHAQTIPAAAQHYRRDLVRAAHSAWGLDAPIAVFAAQVHQESAWRPNAISHVGARGLAQFMPATARWWCERTGTPPDACLPHNPTWALRALVGYDRWLYERTPARYSAFDRWWVALRAYNGGLGHWQREAAATGLAQPSRQRVDAACGQARRHASHCLENLGYPARILIALQPRYASWGQTVEP